MPYSLRPPDFSRASKIVTSWPATASAWAQARPAGPAPTIGDAPAGRRGAGERGLAGLHLRVDGVALQQADANRLALRRLAHARLFAQRLGRADARAHAAHDVGLENRARRAERIAGGDLADEQGDVDRGRAGAPARRVVTEVAAVGLDARFVDAQRRMQVDEIRLQRRAVEAGGRDVGDPGRFGDDSHHGSPAARRGERRLEKS